MNFLNIVLITPLFSLLTAVRLTPVLAFSTEEEIKVKKRKERKKRYADEEMIS